MSDPLEIVLTRMQARNNSKQTMDRFRLYITKFLEFTKQKGIKFKDVDCNTFMDYLAISNNVCGNTKATMFYAMRTIFQIWGKPWTLERAEVPKKSTPNQPWYNIEEIKKIVATADKLDFASSALVRISRDCGCRRAAIREMTRKDFKKGEDPTLLVGNPMKHSIPTEVQIANDTAESIRKMLEHRKDKSPYLFVDEKGNQIGLVRLSNLFTRVAKLAGVYKPGAGIHAMRRSKVTRLQAAGLDQFEITSAMGWQPGSSMLSVYCQLDKSKLQKKAANADPLMKNGE